jgi:hypothetical protein
VGYTRNRKKGVFDTLLAETLENLVADEVKDQLYTGGIELPTMYQELKKQLMTISWVLELKKLRMGALAQNSQFWVPNPHQNAGQY